jgi:hypothetical protein
MAGWVDEHWLRRLFHFWVVYYDECEGFPTACYGWNAYIYLLFGH